MSEVMKKCCGLCPYSRKNTLFLHPKRAEEFAYQANNPYTDFICHKTGVVDEDNEYSSGDIIRGEKSLTCAGFHVMQSEINGKKSDIKVDYEDHFTEDYEMIEHHEENHNENN